MERFPGKTFRDVEFDKHLGLAGAIDELRSLGCDVELKPHSNEYVVRVGRRELHLSRTLRTEEDALHAAMLEIERQEREKSEEQ